MSHLAASTPYVFQRRNTFYFRFTFSRIISKLVGKRELRYSLRTGYRQSAIRRAMGLVVQVERFVWQLQKDTKLWAEIDLKPFNNTEITTLEEHIKRKWADISAETAGEQYTPDDVIALIAEIITLLNSADYCLDAGVHHSVLVQLAPVLKVSYTSICSCCTVTTYLGRQ